MPALMSRTKSAFWAIESDVPATPQRMPQTIIAR